MDKIIGILHGKETFEGSLNNNIPDVLDKNYIHTQSEASDEWIISHGLGKAPSVTVVDSGNNVVVGDIQYIDLNNVIVRFLGAFSGKAYLN